MPRLPPPPNRNASPAPRVRIVRPNYGELDEGLLGRLHETSQTTKEAEAQFREQRARLTALEQEEAQVRVWLNSAGLRRQRTDAKRQQREQLVADLRLNEEEKEREQRLRVENRNRERERKAAVHKKLGALRLGRKDVKDELRGKQKDWQDLRSELQASRLAQNKKEYTEAKQAVAVRKQALEDAKAEKLQKLNESRAQQKKEAREMVTLRREQATNEQRERIKELRLANQQQILRASSQCLLEKRRQVLKGYEEREAVKRSDAVELAERLNKMKLEEIAQAERRRDEANDRLKRLGK